ncbi:DUF2141 domain-containing protein [Neolewinella persica]|uniref:DUF2141 domain-containing protein n=1 Tax=Neolewinella persica TaxID=70998 RepID=UPI0003681750|nr:DUF2141 domain-containing protein [Neolewinella persica]
MNLFLFLTGLLLFSGPQTVSVTVSSSSAEAGEIRLAVYASETDFKEQRAVTSIIKPTTGASVNLKVDLPQAGTYVLAAFHDVNGNGKLDRNFFGIPTEPYGFSRPPVSKWEEPRFGDISATFSDKKASARVELKLWKEY